MFDYATELHICKDQDMFDNLQVGRFASINMGNNSKMKVEGIGRVRLKLHEDKVKILPDVLYVPDSRVNIISLRELASEGYKDIGVRKFCKVWLSVYKRTKEDEEYLPS